MAWRPGPLPCGTYGHGAVVLADQVTPGFYFADFLGESARVAPGTPGAIVVRAERVMYWNNCLGPSPAGAGRAEGAPGSEDES
jgi:hypothetical protein